MKWKETLNFDQILMEKIWEPQAPLKAQLFYWFAIQKRIKTKMFLLKTKILNQNDSAICVLCGQELEESNHLLLHCRVS